MFVGTQRSVDASASALRQ